MTWRSVCCLDQSANFPAPKLLVLCVNRTETEEEEDQAQRTSLEAGKTNPVKETRQIVTAY